MKTKPFAKLYGEGNQQVLLVVDLGGAEPSIAITVQVPGFAMATSKFLYDDTEEGRKQCRKKFDEITEESGKRLGEGIRQGLKP